MVNPTEFDSLVQQGAREGHSIREIASMMGVPRGRVERALRRARKAEAPPSTALAKRPAPPPPEPEEPDLREVVQERLEASLATGDVRTAEALSRIARRLGDLPPRAASAEFDPSGLSEGEFAIWECAAWIAAGRPDVGGDRRAFERLIKFATPEPAARGSGATQDELDRFARGDLDALPPDHPLSRHGRSIRCIACHLDCSAEHRVCGECKDVVLRVRTGMPVANPGETVLGRVPDGVGAVQREIKRLNGGRP